MILNEIFYGILSIMIRARGYYEGYKRNRYTPIHIIVQDPSSRMFVAEIDLPATRLPIRIILYISTQDWYMTPSKIEPKINKVHRYRRKYSESPADTYIAIVSKRATSGAEKLSNRSGVPHRTPKKVRKDMAKYFSKRFNGLLASLRGRRVFGELVYLIYILQELARYYGYEVPEVIGDPIELQRYAEQGFILPETGPPPPAG